MVSKKRDIVLIDDVRYEDAPAQEEIVSAVAKRLKLEEGLTEEYLYGSLIPVVEVNVDALLVQSRRDARSLHVSLAEKALLADEANPILIDSSTKPYLVIDGRHRVIAAENLEMPTLVALDISEPRFVEKDEAGPVIDFRLLRKSSKD